MVQTDLPPSVEVAVTRQQQDTTRWLIHLIPEYTRRRWGDRLDAYAPQPPLDISLSLDLDASPTTARLLRAGTDGVITQTDDRVNVHLAQVSGPDILILT